MSDENVLFYDAAVARVSWPHNSGVSAVLTRRRMAFLTVKPHFQGHGVAGLSVLFFKANEDGSKGAQLGDAVTTDSMGVARLPRLVPVGHYVCEIEQQPLADITTIPEYTETFALALPIGRHVVDVEAGIDLHRSFEENE